jgi:transposase
LSASANALATIVSHFRWKYVAIITTGEYHTWDSQEKGSGNLQLQNLLFIPLLSKEFTTDFFTFCDERQHWLYVRGLLTKWRRNLFGEVLAEGYIM